MRINETPQMPQITLKLLNGELFTIVCEWGADQNRLNRMIDLDAAFQKLIHKVAEQTDSIESQVLICNRDGQLVETSLVYGTDTNEFKENVINSPGVTTLMTEWEKYGDRNILLVWIEPILNVPYVSRAVFDRIHEQHSYDSYESYPDRCILWFNLVQPLGFEVFYWDEPTRQILRFLNVLSLEFDEDRIQMSNLARERLHQLRKKIEQIKT